VPNPMRTRPVSAAQARGYVAKAEEYLTAASNERESPVTTPVITIEVDDIDRALETINSLGGSTVRPKMPVMDMGFAAYFRDCEDNLMGLWQNAS
jgi:predicted enzyme related to lactoylglutathione lyase